MIIKSASIKVTQVGQAAYDIWFIKSGQVISYYRLPRDSVDVGSRELSLSSGSLFPFEADSVKIGADFVVNENILIINSGEKQINLPSFGKTKTVNLGLNLTKILIVAGIGFLVYTLIKKRK